MPERSIAEEILAAGNRSLADCGDSFQTAALLADVGAFIRRYVVVSAKQLIVAAVWILHTHVIEAAQATLFLRLKSPEKRSGKTRFLKVVSLLVRRPLMAVSTSEAALFRAIAKWTPTLLLDEVDAIFGSKAKEHETLRGILNAGNERGSTVLRMAGEGKSMDVKEFPVFCPRAFAAIGDLPDTIMDRAVTLQMKRKTKAETVERFRTREAGPLANALRERIVSWAAAALPQLQTASPQLPDELDDRAADGAEPLLAIADLAQEDWPARVRAALVELCSGEGAGKDETEGVRLLSDIRKAFHAIAEDRLSSEDLRRSLSEMEESPWGGLTKRWLAEKLRPYQIRSKQIRFGDGPSVKGYMRVAFEEAWERYLPPPLPVPETGVETKQAKQSNNGGPPALFPDAKQNTPETKQAKPVSPVSDLGLNVSREPGDESSIETGFVSDVSNEGPFPEGGGGEDEEVGF